MTDDKSDTERVADALERLADELVYQNAILTEQARAQHLTAVSANEYSEPDDRPRSAPNTRSLLTMIRDNESERERAENRRLMADGSGSQQPADSQDVHNVRSARAILDDYEDVGTEIRDGSLKHAIEELKNARRKLDDY